LLVVSGSDSSSLSWCVVEEFYGKGENIVLSGLTLWKSGEVQEASASDVLGYLKCGLCKLPYPDGSFISCDLITACIRIWTLTLVLLSDSSNLVVLFTLIWIGTMKEAVKGSLNLLSRLW